VKPQTGVQEHLGRGSERSVRPPDASEAAGSGSLSDDQTRVLESLRAAGSGLTVKQLETRLPDLGTTVEDVLGRLVERRLVGRLNTLIPTYTYRSPEAKAHAR
jgi:hypothetical protein